MRRSVVPRLLPAVRNKASKHQKRDEEKAEGRARTQSVLSQSQGAAKGGRIDKLSAARAAIYQAAATVAANLEGHKQASARVAAARADVARAAADAVRLTPKRYGDSDYWEERHAESGKNDETYEWYTGYPDKALRKVRQVGSRGGGEEQFWSNTTPCIVSDVEVCLSLAPTAIGGSIVAFSRDALRRLMDSVLVP